MKPTKRKRTQFELLLDAAQTAIDVATSSGKGQHLRRQPLLRELLGWVVTRASAPSVAALDRTIETRLEELATRRDQVAGALHALHRHDLSPKLAAKLATIPKVRVTTSDLAAVSRLARRAGVSLRDLDREADAAVRAGVDGYFERLVVVMDRRALEDMLLAALEAYAVPKPGKGQKYTEVFGYCFGTRRDLQPEGPKYRFRRILAVDRVVTQLRNRASAGEVFPSQRSERLHMQIAAEFFEHQMLIGDYHTHPWQTLKKLRAMHGWTPSQADRIHITGWAANARNAGGYPRFSLIAAVARGGKVGRSAAREAKNRVRLCVGGLYVVIAAYRLLWTDEYDEEVFLHCPGVPDVEPR